jgi:proteasome lid subunit RPN8/RPN11
VPTRAARTTDPGRIRIRTRVIAAIVDHARRDAPFECCGLLAARDDVIDEAIAARNLEASPVAFLIDPADHFAALKRTRAEGREIVGAYHSHPSSPAVPSPTDLAHAHYEEFVYVIVSLARAQPDVRAYRLVSRSQSGMGEAGFAERRFEIADEGSPIQGFED